MTILAKLLAQKQQLIERLEANPDPQQREKIERLLKKINTALDLLDESGPGTGGRPGQDEGGPVARGCLVPEMLFVVRPPCF